MSITSDYTKVPINGKQVSLLAARAAEKGIKGRALLEWLEFSCDIPVEKLEEVKAFRLNFILNKLAQYQP